jgi:hypothetical protein
VNIRRTFAIAWFFTKTMYLSPVNNPMFFLLLVTGGAFFFGGGLGKHEAVLLLLLAGISNRYVSTCQTRRGVEESPDSRLSRYPLLWPAGRCVFFAGFQLSNIAFILALVVPCLYVGTHCETPPVIGAICPPRTCVTRAPSGEPVVTVEEVLFAPDDNNDWRPVKFTIPVSHSLLFGYLASGEFIGKDRIPDSLLRDLCPISRQTVSPNEIFGPPSQRESSPQYYSDFLAKLPPLQERRLFSIACFALLFFLMDGIAKYEAGKPGAINRMFGAVRSAYTIAYLGMCGLFVLDVLLPESMLAQMSLAVGSMGAFPRAAFLTALVTGSVWIAARWVFILRAPPGRPVQPVLETAPGREGREIPS